ncbi:MAG: hypothetical protein ACOYL6_02185 [Bacteriovoracaceae bacterium]
MKSRNLLLKNMALVSLLTGAFSFSAFAQKKAAQTETVKPKVKTSSNKTEPKTETVEIEEEKTEAPAKSSAHEPTSTPSNNAGILGMGAPHSHSVGLAIGQTFPMGNFNKYGDSRVSLPDLLYSYSASYSFDFFLDVHYSIHKAPDRELKLFGFAPAVKAKLFQFDAFSPFILGGLGFYVPEWEDHGNQSKRKMVFGTNIGLGGDLKLNQNFTVGVLFTHHNPFDVKQDVGPKVEGHYAKMLLTGMYTF